MTINKGYIISTSQGGLRCKVKTFENEILDNVLILQPYGDASNIEADETSLVLLFYPQGSKTSAFAIPYNPPLQPSLEITEKAIGNFKIGNQIVFKSNGDIVVNAENDLLAAALSNLNIQATTKITLNAPDISLSDAVGLVLNDAATMQVVISGGSSAGTYPVDIVDAGQSKVKA